MGEQRHRDPDTAWRAMAGPPLRFLTSSWPWRATAYLLSGLVVATLWVAGLALAAVPVFGLIMLFSGIPVGAVERWRLRLVDPGPAPSAHARLVQPGPGAWLLHRFRETATWRELGYAVLFSLGLAWLDTAVGLMVLAVAYIVAWPVLVHLVPQYTEALFGLIPNRLPEAFLATALGVAAAAPVAAYLVTAYAAGRAALTRRVLSRRDPALDLEMRELSRSRARILDAMDAQRRRIERDLHDGAQQRLTGLIMTLGLARLQLANGPPASGDLVEQAYQQARTALAELRDLVHGIHPQVLTDRGLAPAVSELAERCPVPVEVGITLPRRLPEPVEAAAWFIIGEALTNVARHSHATRAWIRCHEEGDQVVIEVGDDGLGGADSRRGTGLVGLADRVSVLAGTIALASPAGGPTVLRAELPCAW